MWYEVAEEGGVTTYTGEPDDAKYSSRTCRRRGRVREGEGGRGKARGCERMRRRASEGERRRAKARGVVVVVVVVVAHPVRLLQLRVVVRAGFEHTQPLVAALAVEAP